MIRPLIVACVLSVAAPAAAAAQPGWLERARAFAAEKLDQASDALEPPLVPPQPIAVTYRARRIGTLELGAPLLELIAIDLDGDGRDELVALTTREVLVLQPPARSGVSVRARAPLPAAPASVQPRDPVGALTSGGPGLVRARSSTQAAGAAYAWSDGRLVAGDEIAGFPLCPTLSAELAPGRNYFQGDDGAAFHAVRCFAGMVDATGRRLSASAVLPLEGALSVRLRVRCPRKDQACQELAPQVAQVERVGIAFAVTDLDRDGTPELVASSAAPPGSPDAVRVLSLVPGGAVERYRKEFAGGVAGIASGDLDGDGAAEVLVAVRTAGSTRVDWWTLH